MKELTENLIREFKEQQFLKKLYQENTIELDNYFKYSGLREENNELESLVPKYRKKPKEKI
jgi:hypothetical protein|tara:strand:- start:517 stop:699 length:183 start_codon:yes stop_codon:yes gene_type:complete